MLIASTALESMDQAVATLPEVAPNTFCGQGIVVCGGGRRYFPSAWVCLNMLRRHGCKLPIELWHLGPQEMNDNMRALVETLNVKCVDAFEVRRHHPVRNLNGWELKPFAIMHSSFRQTLLLDADNVPVMDPTYLFQCPQFLETGAVFWPDFNRLARNRSIWELTGVTYENEAEFETGQVLVDKVRCWKALSLTMWMNEHSYFWYQHVHGDKETFHMAWRRLEQPYSMVPHRIRALPATMCQHDFEGRRIFQHRNMAKWNMDSNRSIPGFEHELTCLEYLRELESRRKAIFGVARYNSANQPPEILQAAARLTSGLHFYRRVGHDGREMEFRPDGLIGVGSAPMEQIWDLHVTEKEGQLALDIQSATELTCRLYLNKDGLWRGRWERFERMPIEVGMMGERKLERYEGVLKKFAAGATMEYEEYLLIYETILAKSPCKVLVFGQGSEAQLWIQGNRNGRTAFIDDDRTKSPLPGASLDIVDYNTRLSQQVALLAQHKQGNRSALHLKLPAEIESTEWDVIIVDGPAGYAAHNPGRMKSIVAARRLCHSSTDVFIHDVDRPVEKNYSDYFWGGDFNLTRKLRHYTGCHAKGHLHSQGNEMLTRRRQDTTVVSAVSPNCLSIFKTNFPTWQAKPQFAGLPMIVFHNGFSDPENELDFVKKAHNVELIHWTMPDYKNTWDLMIASFVLGAVHYVNTEYYIKLDADCYFCGRDDMFNEEHFQYALCAPTWNKSRSDMLLALDKWAAEICLAGRPFLDSDDKLDRAHSEDGYRHARINSWICLHKTQFVRECVSHITDFRMPVPSHDTFLWYMANRLDYPWMGIKTVVGAGHDKRVSRSLLARKQLASQGFALAD